MINRPWCAKLELTQDCNLRCKFCPISTIGPKKIHATPEIMAQIGTQLAELNPDLRIEIAGRGEPLLAPDAVECVRRLREPLPHAHIGLFTNGVLLLKNPNLAKELFAAGLNILNVECYNGTYDRHRANMEKTGVPVHHFSDFSAYRKHPRAKYPAIVLVPDILEDDARVRQLHNVAGAIPPVTYKPKQLPLAKRCAHPFREITVNSDGEISFCCVDWRHQASFGNVATTTLRKAWYSKKRRAMLTRLYNQDRNFTPCRECDYHGGYRLGLIPNPAED